MLNAKDKFKEGYIMLLRPFDFVELQYPLQKLTILYAYSERPIFRKLLIPSALEEIRLIENSSGMFYNNERKDADIDKIVRDDRSYENYYEGDIVQCYVEGHLCRFYPDEYNIIKQNTLDSIFSEEGYHCIVNPAIREHKAFKDKLYYCMTRGIDKTTSEKYASYGFKDLVYFKPYYELLDAFSRHIYPDKFYEEVEGIKCDEHNESRRTYIGTNHRYTSQKDE